MNTRPLRRSQLASVLALLAGTLSACTVGDDADGGTVLDASFDSGPPDAFVPDAGPPVDAFVDPFDPDAGCGFATIETERLPGSILFVFDRSGSMGAPPVSGGSGPSRWDIAGDAIESVLDTTDDQVNTGMLLFPAADQSMCNVALTDTVPQVPVAALSTSRTQIAAQLAMVPDGMATPVFGALRAGWDHLDALGSRGNRALVLVTDGRENCDEPARDAVLNQAASELTDDGHLTFAIGLTQSDSDLSTLALNGGTRRSETCFATCTTEACILDSDEPCPDTGAACTSFPEGEGGRIPGFCGCVTGADCPSPMTCELVGEVMACVGTPNCCHYNASATSFESDFSAALDAVTELVVDPCLFDLPRGSDPSLFDPNEVNVRVSLDGEDAEVIRRSSDPTESTWDYVDEDQETIVLQGELCDRLNADSATVEIVLGCPTILI